MADELKRELLRKELEAVRALDPNRILHAEAVVRWARDHPESVLHSEFEWSDSVAAELYRVHQARSTIRVVVTQSEETGRMVRHYVSLSSDRTHGGGYRPVQDALAKGRQEMISEALAKLRNFGNQYTHLPELQPLFVQVGTLVEQFRAQKDTAAA